MYTHRGHCPVYAACVLEYLRCRCRLLISDGALRKRAQCSVADGADGAQSQFGSEMHETVMKCANSVVGQDFNCLTVDNVAGVDLLTQEECSHSCAVVTIDYSPVDGRCTTVAG